MSLDPLLAAPIIVQIHAFGAMAAFVLGLIQFTAPKGTFPHRTLGLIWMVLMATIIISSIFIRPALSPGIPLARWFGPIHIFTIVTTIGLVRGGFFLLKGGPDLKSHKSPFTSIYIGGLIIAGAFAFLPGRIMYRVIIGG